MINRISVGADLLEICNSMLNSDLINPIASGYANLPNPKRLFEVVKGRDIVECKDKGMVMLFCYLDNTRTLQQETTANVIECDMIIGSIRHSDAQAHLEGFTLLNSVISALFDEYGLRQKYAKLSDLTGVKENVHLADLGVANMQYRGFTPYSSDCGIYKTKHLVRFSITAKRDFINLD